MRHLSEEQTLSVLRRGASVEQMLTENLSDGTIQWLRVLATGGGFVLGLHRNLDDGSDDFLDVYEFRSVDESDEVGEGLLVGEYSDAPSVLAAAQAVGARMDRWVNAGVIQDEYADLRNRS